MIGELPQVPTCAFALARTPYGGQIAQMKLPLIAALILAFAFAVSSRGADALRTFSDPAELVAKRVDCLRDLQRASIPILTNYLHQIEALKEQYTRRGDLHAALSVDEEIKKTQQQLDAANATSQGARGSIPVPIEITSARWQAADPNQSADVTAHLKQLMESGAASVTVNTQEAAGGVDPARGQPKSLILEYLVNGKAKQKTFKEGGTLIFRELK
jgi:hypothetical protein